MRAPVGLLAALMLCGCQDLLTEVVMVVDTDLAIPNDVDMIALSVGGQTVSQSLFELPASLGFLPGEASSRFAVDVRLMRSSDGAIVVSRSATSIRFVEGRTMMFVLMLSAACSCAGTNCPNPGINPSCDPLVDPTLVPLSIDVAGRSRRRL